jgi:hypothetical protein
MGCQNPHVQTLIGFSEDSDRKIALEGKNWLCRPFSMFEEPAVTANVGPTKQAMLCQKNGALGMHIGGESRRQ